MIPKRPGVARRKIRVNAFTFLVTVTFGAIFCLLRLQGIYTTMASQEQQQQEANTEEAAEMMRHENQPRLGPIFYNIFIPMNDTEKRANAVRIVQEQMQQREWSSEPNSTIWYTIIGDATVIQQADLCHGQHQHGDEGCRRLNHFEEGDEVNTLQSLWDYCQDHPQMLVTYIHDKGSFHNTRHNEQTRRTATKAALDCRTEMALRLDLSPYNVCTSIFIILPQYLSKANMWTAKCDYIRKLISPSRYESTMQHFYNDTLSSTNPQFQKKYACLKPIHWRDNHLGLGRYSYERWVWSHPDLIPADVIPFGKIDFDKYPPTWRPSLGRSLKGSPRRMSLHQGFGESSFARLEGRLLEWEYVYHQQPNNASWIWSYYLGFETGSPSFKTKHCPLES